MCPFALLVRPSITRWARELRRSSRSRTIMRRATAQLMIRRRSKLPSMQHSALQAPHGVNADLNRPVYARLRRAGGSLQGTSEQADRASPTEQSNRTPNPNEKPEICYCSALPKGSGPCLPWAPQPRRRPKGTPAHQLLDHAGRMIP
jgi:hypothetical protein